MIVFIVLFVFFAMQESAAEPDRSQLRQDIHALDKKVNREEKKVAALRAEVRALEKKLGEQTRKAYSLERKIRQVGKRLEKANKEKEVLQDELEIQKKGLSQQMLALYSAGEQSHLRMLLKQDDPSDIGRTVKYFEYLNRSRIKKIQGVKTTLEKLQQVTNKIKADRDKLQKLQENLRMEQKASRLTLSQRERVYKKMSQQVKNKKQRLQELKRKEAKLQNKINRLVAQQAVRTQQRPAAVAKKEKAPRSESRRQEKTTAEVSFKPASGNRKFSASRGKLPWPVKGKIIHVYGERRNEKQRWKGTVIAAPGGRKVRAIADGKVEFAGWFAGYGYLVIIRHDQNYRSLYGYNRAVYVSTGQQVKGGTVIAAVGNSGGQQKNALYFEIRKGTKPRNPAKWCR